VVKNWLRQTRVVSWVVTLCDLRVVGDAFRKNADKKAAMQSSETLVNIHKSARSYNPKEKTSIDMLTAAKPKNFKF
jgi:hypothetical protein